MIALHLSGGTEATGFLHAYRNLPLQFMLLVGKNKGASTGTRKTDFIVMRADSWVSARPLRQAALQRGASPVCYLLAASLLAAMPCSAQTKATSSARPKKVPSGIDVGSVVAEEQSRIRNSRPKGEPTAISLFGGKPVQGRKFVFLIDRSKSMRLGALAAAEQELIQAVSKLQPHHEFQIIAYSSQCTYLRQRKLLAATDENKQAIEGFLKGLSATGTTEHEMALESGLQHRPDAIFLLTDGGHPELTDKQILRLTKIAADRTAIHCIQFGFGEIQEPKNFLQYLANQNHGTFAFQDMSRK